MFANRMGKVRKSSLTSGIGQCLFHKGLNENVISFMENYF